MSSRSAPATNRQVQWLFDNDFRVASESVNGQTAVGFQYDPDGLLTEAGALTLTRHAAHGFITGATLGPVTTTCGRRRCRTARS